MERPRTSFFRSLSVQLLVLTVFFATLVALIIYIPSVAQSWKNYLDQRLVAAQIAALSLEETPGQEVSPMLETELLSSAEIQAVIVLREDSRQLILRSTLPSSISAFYDLREIGPLDLIMASFDTLYRGGEGSIQVQGSPINTRHQSVQIVLDEGPLYLVVSQFSRDFLQISLLVVLFASVLIYLAILFFLVRPTTRIAENLVAFSKTPEAHGKTLKPSGRKDEVGLLEFEVKQMQTEVRKALKQQSRLANLGLAVSKINHDLKNILSTARLSMEMLERKPSGKGQAKIMERFLRSVDRAVALGERTLKYGKAEEPPAEKKMFVLRDLVKGVQSTYRESGASALKWKIEIPPSLEVYADREQIFRVLFNLTRNAQEAMNGKGTISISATKKKGETLQVFFEDQGPGIPETVQENLFVPFAGSTKGGSGLGLVIAKELVEANGGQLALVKTGETGTTFGFTLTLK
ncbi:MAG: HAMP domain-containing sensor histidine kinase [Sphingomonadales bacterium]